MLEEKNITISVQINGKLRSTLEIEKGANQEVVTKMALNLEKIQAHIPNGTPVKKIIFVLDRMINFVI
jgi:leucyl-tRNA synthetase